MNLRPGEISITNSPSGKPFVKQHLQAPPFCFNLSHAGNLVVYAFTLGNEIGIDLECIYPIADLEALIERYYSKNEKDLLRVASSENRHRLFLQYWVRKEAYIKARGAGLALIGSDLDVSAIPVPALALTPFNPIQTHDKARWSLIDLIPGPTELGALVVEGHDLDIKYMKWGVDGQVTRSNSQETRH